MPHVCIGVWLCPDGEGGDGGGGWSNGAVVGEIVSPFGHGGFDDGESAGGVKVLCGDVVGFGVSHMVGGENVLRHPGVPVVELCQPVVKVWGDGGFESGECSTAGEWG